MPSELLKARRDFSNSRLSELRDSVSKIPQLAGLPDLSIYVTGSYGRLEAHKHSDLDLFLVSQSDSPVERTRKILIDAELIRIAELKSFPPFSNDAQYLEVHSLSEMLEKLGGPEDDSKNFFTARMLLLLESRSISGNENYRRIVERIIDSYFRDFHDHTGDFRPLFLVNDILRFWKTLCLNYENKRNRIGDRAAKNKHHLKNLKLKFSRLLICFSTIIPLFASRTNSPDEVLRLTELAPLERLQNIVQNERQRELYHRLTDLYEYFLNIVSDPSVLDWIGTKEHRRVAFPKADEFGTTMFTFLSASLKQQEDIRFLII